MTEYERKYTFVGSPWFENMLRAIFERDDKRITKVNYKAQCSHERYFEHVQIWYRSPTKRQGVIQVNVDGDSKLAIVRDVLRAMEEKF